MYCIIVGEWITVSEKRDHLLYILSGGLINTFSIYFIHTLTIKSLHCLCVGMADLFHSKTFF